MNATFKQISTIDAGKMLGVDKTTVANWCRRGIINFIDVSEPKSSVPRYVLTEEEVDRIKRTMKRYGKKNWYKHYKKDKPMKSKKTATLIDDSHIFETSQQSVSITSEVQVVQEETQPKTSSFDDEIENLSKTIMYIKDIKERLNDLEAEKNQLLNELDSLRNEVLAYI